MSYDEIPNRNTETCSQCGGALKYEDREFIYQTDFLEIETSCEDCGWTICLTTLKITSEAQTEWGKSQRRHWLLLKAREMEDRALAYDNEANPYVKRTEQP